MRPLTLKFNTAKSNLPRIHDTKMSTFHCECCCGGGESSGSAEFDHEMESHFSKIVCFSLILGGPFCFPFTLSTVLCMEPRVTTDSKVIFWLAILALIFMPLIFILVGAVLLRNNSDRTIPIVFVVVGGIAVVTFLGLGVIKYTRRIRREEQKATPEETEKKRRDMIIAYVYSLWRLNRLTKIFTGWFLGFFSCFRA